MFNNLDINRKDKFILQRAYNYCVHFLNTSDKSIDEDYRDDVRQCKIYLSKKLGYADHL